MEKNQSLGDTRIRDNTWSNVFLLSFLIVFSIFSIGIVSAWDDDLNRGLVLYYTFNDTINNSIITGENLTVFEGAPNYKGGKINNSGNVTAGNNWQGLAATSVFQSNNNRTINVWLKANKLVAGMTIFDKYQGAGVGWAWVSDVNGKIVCMLDCGSAATNNNALRVNQWVMITLVHNGTTNCLYVNATLTHCVSGTNRDSTRVMHFGNTIVEANDYDGLYDENGWWNRSLNQSEIDTLYNNGLGTTYYPTVPPVARYGTLLPKNNSVVVNTPVTFVANLSIDSAAQISLKNVTLYVYDSTNSLIYTELKNVSGTENLTSFTSTLNALGNYKYNFGYCTEGADFYDLDWHACHILGQYYPNRDYNYTFFWGYDFYSQVYNVTTSPSKTESISLYVNYSSTIFPTISANLIYNGTVYAATKTGTGDIVNFSKTLNQNITGTFSFYWNVSFTNTTGSVFYANTSNRTQIVSALTGLVVSNNSCAEGFNTSYIFTFADEDTRNSIKANVSYNIDYGVDTSGNFIYGNFSNIERLYICINSESPQYRIEAGEIDYSTSGYGENKYYLFRGTRFNYVPTNVTLYQLPTAVATAFEYTITDNNYNPQINVFLGLLRWYPELNSYIVTSMGKTDDYGKTISKIKVEDIDYRVGVYSLNGTLIKLNNPVRFICSSTPCTYSIFLLNPVSSYTDLSRLQSSLTFNKTSKNFIYIWNDPTQQTQYMNLTVFKDSYNMTQVLCSVQGVGFTGLLTCDVSAYTGSVRAVVIRSASPLLEIANLYVNLATTFIEINGGKVIGLIMTLVLFVLAVLIGLYSPIAAIILGIAALLPSMYVGIINPAVFVGIVLIGGVIIHFMRRA